MNERIEKLAEHAEKYADDKIRMPGEYHPDWHDVRDEKFAELIVRECADIFGREGTGEYQVAGNWIAKTIKQHFGVGE